LEAKFIVARQEKKEKIRQRKARKKKLKAGRLGPEYDHDPLQRTVGNGFLDQKRVRCRVQTEKEKAEEG